MRFIIPVGIAVIVVGVVAVGAMARTVLLMLN